MEIVRPPLIDTHAHLAMLDHAPLEEILKRAHEAGVKRMISISTDEPSWESNRNLALAHSHISYTIGLHPHDAIRWAECAPQFFELFKDGAPKKCVGVGELGLDFHYDLSPREVQLDVLEAQIEIAKKVSLPIIIHCRDAFDEMFTLFRRLGLGKRGGVMHCFTGDLNRARQALDLGLKLSFSGIVTFKNADSLREAAKFVPDSEILVETDCPFLAPVPLRGKPCEPAHVSITAAFLAKLRGAELLDFAELTTKNAINFFQLN